MCMSLILKKIRFDVSVFMGFLKIFLKTSKFCYMELEKEWEECKSSLSHSFSTYRILSSERICECKFFERTQKNVSHSLRSFLVPSGQNMEEFCVVRPFFTHIRDRGARVLV